MRLYKRASKYWIDLRDPSGTRRRLPALESKRASEAYGRNLEALRDCQTARERPDKALLQWIEGLPQDTRERLARYGFLDQERAHAAQGLKAHLADFEKSLDLEVAAGRIKPKRATAVMHRARAIVNGCAFKTLQDIQASPVDAWLSEQRRTDTHSARTSNYYLQAFGQFIRWLIREGRLHDNPISRIRPASINSSNITLERRALSPDEMRIFLRATKDGPAFRGMDGPTWAILFQVAAETGYRWNELRSLRRASFALTATPPVAILAASDTKNGQDAIQPLRESTAALLEPFLARKLPTAPAFPMPKTDCGAKACRFYLERAGIPFEDESGRRFDFHALRGQFATSLARAGVSLAAARDLMRHSTVDLTAKHYTHFALEDRSEAVSKLPDLEAAPTTEAGRATGTLDAKPDDPACAIICATSLQNHRKSSDTTGQPGLKITKAGILPDTNKKPADAVSGHSTGLNTGATYPIRTGDLRFTKPLSQTHNPIPDKEDTKTTADPCAGFCATSGTNDPDLVRLLASWNSLDEAQKRTLADLAEGLEGSSKGDDR